MKRHLKPFIVERKRRLPSAGQPTSIWSDVMTPELRALADQTQAHEARTDTGAEGGMRLHDAPSGARPAHRTGRILISRVDQAPVLTEKLEPISSAEPEPHRRRSSAARVPEIRSPDITATPTEADGITVGAVEVRSAATSPEAPEPCAAAVGRLPYRVRRREATMGLKFEDRWKRGLILRY